MFYTTKKKKNFESYRNQNIKETPVIKQINSDLKEIKKNGCKQKLLQNNKWKKLTSRVNKLLGEEIFISLWTVLREKKLEKSIKTCWNNNSNQQKKLFWDFNFMIILFAVKHLELFFVKSAFSRFFSAIIALLWINLRFLRFQHW